MRDDELNERHHAMLRTTTGEKLIEHRGAKKKTITGDRATIMCSMVQTFKHVRDSNLPGSTEYLVMLTPMDETCDEFRPGGDLAYSKVTTLTSTTTMAATRP